MSRNSGGHAAVARRFAQVAADAAAWETYCRETFEACAAAAPRRSDGTKKLRWMTDSLSGVGLHDGDLVHLGWSMLLRQVRHPANAFSGGSDGHHDTLRLVPSHAANLGSRFRWRSFRQFVTQAICHLTFFNVTSHPIVSNSSGGGMVEFNDRVWVLASSPCPGRGPSP